MNTTTDYTHTDRLIKGHTYRRIESVRMTYTPEPIDWPLVIFRVLRVALWTALIVGVAVAYVMTR